MRDKQKLLAEVHRIRGQVEAIERALDKEEACARVMQRNAGQQLIEVVRSDLK